MVNKTRLALWIGMQLPSHKNRGDPFRDIWGRPCPIFYGFYGNLGRWSADANFWPPKASRGTFQRHTGQLNNSMVPISSACNYYNTVITFWWPDAIHLYLEMVNEARKALWIGTCLPEPRRQGGGPFGTFGPPFPFYDRPLSIGEALVTGQSYKLHWANYGTLRTCILI